MKNFQLLIAFFFLLTLHTVATAQVKIGNNPNTINANAILEMETTNKGVLLPRVALTSTTSAAPLAAHVEGMFVYNTATVSDVIEGVYYNDGTQWKLGGGGSSTCQGFGARSVSGSQSLPSSTNTKVLFTAEDWDQGGVFTPATGSFTVSQAGKYLITASCNIGAGSAANFRAIYIFRNNGNLVSGDLNSVAAGISNIGNVTYIADLAAGDVLDLRAYAAGITTNVAEATFSAVKVDCGGSSGGGSAITASNGLTATSGNVTLGGTLTGATTIANGGNNLSITGTGNVGIGTAAPTANAILELASTNRGFLPPRVALTSATDVTTIASPTTGLIVYATGTASLPAGMYYWAGARWVAMGSASKVYASAGISQSGAVNTAAVLCALTPIVDASSTIAANTFTAPRAGRYHFSAVALTDGNNWPTGYVLGGNLILQIVTSAHGSFNSRFQATEAIAASTHFISIPLAATYELNAGETVQFYIINNTGSTKGFIVSAPNSFFTVVEL